jgi:hypothetical protein
MLFHNSTSSKSEMYLIFTACWLLSLQAQELRTPITSMDALLKSDHRLYILCDEVSFLLMCDMFLSWLKARFECVCVHVQRTEKAGDNSSFCYFENDILCKCSACAGAKLHTASPSQLYMKLDVYVQASAVYAVLHHSKHPDDNMPMNCLHFRWCLPYANRLQA